MIFLPYVGFMKTPYVIFFPLFTKYRQIDIDCVIMFTYYLCIIQLGKQYNFFPHCSYSTYTRYNKTNPISTPRNQVLLHILFFVYVIPLQIHQQSLGKFLPRIKLVGLIHYSNRREEKLTLFIVPSRTFNPKERTETVGGGGVQPFCRFS